MNLEVIGTIIDKGEAQQVSERFKKREFVIEIAEEINGNVFTNFAKMQLVQTKCEIIDRFNVGDHVKVNFGLKGNKWEKDGKVNYITNLDAWRVEHAGPATNTTAPSAYTATPSQQASAPSAQEVASFNAAPETTDDLPF